MLRNIMKIFTGFIGVAAISLVGCNSGGGSGGGSSQTPLVTQFVYVLNESDSTVSSYLISTGGTLKPVAVSKVQTGDNSFAIAASGGIALSAGYDSLSSYGVTNGALQLGNTIPLSAPSPLPTTTPSLSVDAKGDLAIIAYQPGTTGSSLSTYSFNSAAVLSPESTITTQNIISAVAMLSSGGGALAGAPGSLFSYNINSGLITPNEPTNGNTISNGIDISSIVLSNSGKTAVLSSQNLIYSLNVGGVGLSVESSLQVLQSPINPTTIRSHVAISPLNNYVYYVYGSTIFTLTIDAFGNLAIISQVSVIPGDVLTGIVVAPNGNYAYVIDSSANQILEYSISSGVLGPIAGSASIATGANPQSISVAY